jgi:hypothetical protein
MGVVMTALLKSNTTRKGLSKILGQSILPGTDCRLLLPNDAERSPVERYIAQQFAEHYGAAVRHFMPCLLTVSCANTLRAAAGIRPAASGALFLEHYLDQPVEQAISQALHIPIARDQIVEIGNLVGTHRGASQLLFLLLIAVLHRAGFHWVTFTGTRQVEQIIQKMQFEITRIGAADRQRLGASADEWGSYYDNHPQLFVGRVDAGMANIQNHPLMQQVLAYYQPVIGRLAAQLSHEG